MPKKNFYSQNKQTAIDKIVGWKPPRFHQASECYVSLSAFDPTIGKFHTKKFMLGHIKGKRNQRQYGEALIKRLTEKLMQGWNPWVEVTQPLEYTSFDEACDRYREYLLKLLKEHNMREETAVSYISRLRVLRRWREKESVNLFYTYQFDRILTGQFLDYVFVDRNNTLQTRNNYLSWLKTFCKYLLERGYIPSDPTAGYSLVQKRGVLKNRDVIPDPVLQELKNWLEANNKHYLLACYILHYLFIRPREMSYLKVGDFNIKRKTMLLHGDHTKNHRDALLTVPDHVMKLMIALDVFKCPSDYYLFSEDFAPGAERRSEKSFRDYWHHHVRKHLKLTTRYKFYSLKDTGITNMLRANTDILTVRDQARHSSILITDIYTPKDIQSANALLLNYKGVL
ncbi:tyrosine-type recombinase/integrase [Hoylesella marshii]|uniref:Site-specific recombinase, phage integrase family n=1 Tax=Hoylesella marshii DSM 16973 = JCM 13450 TaxID=862515 RepID=E0NSS0_9BACT|nr:site-specific integrase [Hoylesella marshii]EFM01784.1 site-specific recombinase, phage integrase family [Hoylesella marshii DSM 16973 = JCM 13450]